MDLVAEVRTALGKQVELPSGKLTGANTELTVKLLETYLLPKEFNNIIIRSEGGKMCVCDIGSAVLGPENIETKLSQSGLPLIGLVVGQSKLFRYFKIIL
jgi:HAE1 family hydrophobic/amphiphilic exporter-1/multidrug efflux pump